VKVDCSYQHDRQRESKKSQKEKSVITDGYFNVRNLMARILSAAYTFQYFMATTYCTPCKLNKTVTKNFQIVGLVVPLDYCCIIIYQTFLHLIRLSSSPLFGSRNCLRKSVQYFIRVFHANRDTNLKKKDHISVHNKETNSSYTRASFKLWSLAHCIRPGP
jgi:hypothetical protein